MRKEVFGLFAVAVLGAAGAIMGANRGANPQGNSAKKSQESANFLGFDSNEYPGDDALAALRKTFAFAGYWLNVPPNASSNSWQGKRQALVAHGFGFVVLFNGRLDRELKSETNAGSLAARDADSAAQAARREGFPSGTVVFLDQEEGGRMLPEQRRYIFDWAKAMGTAGYRAGVYVSGIPARESREVSVITANDLHDDPGGKKLFFFVYNDVCPPAPGCDFPAKAPAPRASGVSFAIGWQFAQSPRRRALTRTCVAKYDTDGNCYAPMLPPGKKVYVDVESATSADPSSQPSSSQ